MDDGKDKDLNWRFENLRRIAEGLSVLFGDHCEVAIHDFKDMKRSLVHVSGCVTDRQIGAPVTDLVVKQLKENGDAVKDLHSYRTRTSSGRVLKSSTCFVRDSKGKVIGAFCVNFDVTDLSMAIKQLETLALTSSEKHPAPTETFAGTFSETMEAILERALEEVGKPAASMTRQEKVDVVRILEREGAFLIKGMAVEVARALGVSRFTVYNYLNEIRNVPK